jgi:hypothetical protein
MTYLTTIAPRLLNYARVASLDEETVTRIIGAECSSSAERGRQKHIGADFINLSPEGVQSPLEGKTVEHSPDGEQIMPSLRKYSPRSPGFQLTQRVDMGKLTANAVWFYQTATAEEVEATLRRAREEYLRRYPNNVPPSSD